MLVDDNTISKQTKYKHCKKVSWGKYILGQVIQEMKQ